MIAFWILSALVSSIFSAPVNNTSPDVTPAPAVQGVKATSVPTPTITETPTPTVTIAPTNTPTSTIRITSTPIPTKKLTPTKSVFVPTTSPVDDYSGLSNDNYYKNSAGNEVHSPAYSDSVPPGASAICGDGTYSFSQSRRGTCSHHGGVSQWL